MKRAKKTVIRDISFQQINAIECALLSVKYLDRIPCQYSRIILSDTVNKANKKNIDSISSLSMRYHQQYFQDNFIQSLLIYSFDSYFYSLFNETHTHNSQIDRREKEKSIDQWDCFYKVKAMSIVCAHLSRASSALLHLSSISRSLHDDDQITFFSIRRSCQPTGERRFFFLLFFFVLMLARSLVLMVGKKRKEGEKYIFIHHCALHTYNSFGRKTRRESCLLFFFSSPLSFLFYIVLCGWMWCCKAPKNARHDAWCIRMQEKKLVSMEDMCPHAFPPSFFDERKLVNIAYSLVGKLWDWYASTIISCDSKYWSFNE